MNFDEFLQSYIECSLWSSVDSEDNPLDSEYDTEDLAQETLDKMRKDCSKFIESITEKNLVPSYNPPIYTDYTSSQLAGHDFWLTRNRHGAGFWARGLPEGDKLTEIAEQFGECNLYVGDDGKIYQG